MQREGELEQQQNQQNTSKQQDKKKVLVAIFVVIILVVPTIYFGYKYYSNYQANQNKLKEESAKQQRAEEINNRESIQNVDQPNEAAGALPRVPNEE